MIPPFNISGVLPPFVGTGPEVRAGTSPYSSSMVEMAKRFSTSQPRIALLKGLIGLRAKLRAIGVDGYQWIDGSFMEDVEKTRGQPPKDIDVVTLLVRPSACKTPADLVSLVTSNPDVFDRVQAKQSYGCDVSYVDLAVGPAVISQVIYWYGLFSHQRSTFLWKGMVVVPLMSDDAAALQLLTTSATP